MTGTEWMILDLFLLGFVAGMMIDLVRTVRAIRREMRKRDGQL